MKILLVGERYSNNLGDPLICETVEYLINKEYPEAEIINFDLSGREFYPDVTQNTDLVKAGRISSYKKIISSRLTKLGIDTEYYKFKKVFETKREYYENLYTENNVNLVIFAGGQIFKDTFIFGIDFITKYFNKLNIPIIFNACGYGEILSSKMKKMLGSSLSLDNVTTISTRDDMKSIKSLLKKDKAIIKTYDPGLFTQEAYQIEKNESNIIGLGVMYAHNIPYKDMINFWRNLIGELNKQNIHWEIFCNGLQKDYEFAHEILEIMGYSHEDRINHINNRPQRPKELVETISKFKLIISFRLHSHIISYSLDIPAVAIVWDKKINFFYESIGFPERTMDIKENSLAVIEQLATMEDYNLSLKKEQKERLNSILIESINNNL